MSCSVFWCVIPTLWKNNLYSWYTVLQLLFSFVYSTAIVDDARLSAEEMDERRRQNIAYEYLCHLEEAKQWVKVYIFHPNESYGLCSGSFWKKVEVMNLSNSEVILPSMWLYSQCDNLSV